MKKAYLYFLCLVSISTFFLPSAFGQDSWSVSNYAGTNALRLNPAELADNRAKVFINLTHLHLNYQNNYARWTAQHGLSKSVLNGANFPGDYTIQEPQNRKSAAIHSRLNGPSISFNFPALQLGIALGVNSDVYLNFDQASDVTATLLYKGTYYQPLQNILHTNEFAQVDAGMYNQHYLTVGKVLYNNFEHSLKIGVTAKRLGSGMSLYMRSNDMNYQLNSLPSGFRDQDIFFQSLEGNFHNASEAFSVQAPWFLSQLSNFSNLGAGFGFDAGFVFEYRPEYRQQHKIWKGKQIPDPTYTKYKWKLGFSIQDVGYMDFNDPSISVGSLKATNQTIPSGSFDDIGTPNEFFDILEAQLALNPSNYTQSFRILTPATIVLHGDYHIKKNWYTAFVLRQRLLPNDRVGPKKLSSFTFVPRYESRWLELLFPMAIDHDYQTLNLGIAGRAGPLFLGITDYTMLVRGLQSRGIGIEAGLSWALVNKNPKKSNECYQESKRKLRKR